MKAFYFLLLVGVVSGQEAAVKRKCNPIDELPCDDGYCIHKLQWCDASLDCWDGSDEMYCNGVNPCEAFHFACRNGRCIPDSAVCDRYDDCHDGSDEEDCDGIPWADDSIGVATEIVPLTESVYYLKEHESDISDLSKVASSTHLGNASIEAVTKAVQYFMNMRDSDYGWGSFTPRAVVALSIASKQLPITDKDKQLMQKQLNIQLLLNLMENQTEMSLSSLALHINALYATCQDPRNFQGVNLVSRLRTETDAAIKSNNSIPLAVLTLCLSNESRHEDRYVLAGMYNTKEFARTGSRALIIMAMSCIMRHETSTVFRGYVEDYFFSKNARVETADVYAQALFMQASNAVGHQSSIDLISQQLLDGSFGDMLSTYYAIPALLNSSLLELACDTGNEGMLVESQMAGIKGENEVAYSLWITSGKNLNSHSMNIKFDGKKSFFDIMMMAAARNPLYKFLYDESSDGKMVYSLAGIPNDIESGRSWFLYSGDIDTVKVNSVRSLRSEVVGVDRIFPEDKNHFVFWLKRD